MSIKQVLSEIRQIEFSSRQTGKTLAICKAAKEIGAIVVCANPQQTIFVRKQFDVQAITMNEMEWLRGHKQPVLYDHFMVLRMADAAHEAIGKLEKDVEEAFLRGEAEQSLYQKAELDRLRRTELIPCLKFSNVDIAKQVGHIQEEVKEVVDAYAESYRDRVHFAFQLVDLQTSCETLLYILKHRHGVDINAVKERVQVKNRNRGYYEFPDCEGEK